MASKKHKSKQDRWDEGVQAIRDAHKKANDAVDAVIDPLDEYELGDPVADVDLADRLGDARKDAENALEASAEAAGNGLSDLQAVQEECDEWRQNMPENLDASATAEKLEEVIDINLGTLEDAINDLSNVSVMETRDDTEQAYMAVSELDEQLGTVEDAEMPLGFGRD